MITPEMMESAIAKVIKDGPKGTKISNETLRCDEFEQLVEWMASRGSHDVRGRIGGAFIAGVETGLRLAEMLAVEEVSR